MTRSLARVCATRGSLLCFCVVRSMADLDEQLPQEGLVKIMMFVGVKYYRGLRFRLILAKHYSDEYDAFCSPLLLDERTASTYRNLLFQTYPILWPDALGSALISDQQILASYHGVLGAICTCRAWVRGVAKYLGVFHSSRDELRELLSLDCKVPCLDNVRLLCAAAVSARATPPFSIELLFKLRAVYFQLHDDVFDSEPLKPDIYISEITKPNQRSILRGRLWRGCRLYRRGMFTHLGR